MNGEYAVYDILSNNEAITAIVNDRIYIDEATQSERVPYIIIEEEDADPVSRSKDGVSTVDHDRVRVYPYSKDRDQLRVLARTIRDVLDDYKGTLTVTEGSVSVTYEIEHIRFEGQISFNERIENRKLYAKDQDYLVRIKQ